MAADADKGERSSVRGWALAAAAGSCAALSAIMAKLASPDMSWEGRFLCYAAVAAFNTAMWAFYASSITILSSVQATVVNFGANFLLSGIAGFLLFSETARPQWFIGATFIVLGILAISKGSKVPEPKTKRL